MKMGEYDVMIAAGVMLVGLLAIAYIGDKITHKK